MENKVRIEYSEKQGWLRIDNSTHLPNTNGFTTIAKDIDSNIADRCCRAIETIQAKQEPHLTILEVTTLFNLGYLLIKNNEKEILAKTGITTC